MNQASRMIPLLFLTCVICCMGQTFQYSHGWKNGKRFDVHFKDEPEYFEVERLLEGCVVNLQRILSNIRVLTTPKKLSHNVVMTVPRYSSGNLEDFDTTSSGKWKSQIFDRTI